MSVGCVLGFSGMTGWGVILATITQSFVDMSFDPGILEKQFTGMPEGTCMAMFIMASFLRAECWR